MLRGDKISQMERAEIETSINDLKQAIKDKNLDRIKNNPTDSLLSMVNPRTFSFGGTSGIVTSMGLIIGLGAATAEESTIVSGLLIVALADNISDSLSIHMYQEAEKLDQHAALRTTLANFLVRFFFALTFVIIVAVLPRAYAGIVSLAWGFLLLGGLSYVLARSRGVSPLSEVGKHLAVAIVVIAASRLIGSWILHYVHGAAR